MAESVSKDRPVWGLAAFCVGVVALILVTIHISGTFVEQEQNPGTTIGEIAAEIRDSAKRALSGEPRPEPEIQSSSWDTNQFLIIAVPVVAGIAMVLGAISLFRREAPTLPTIAIALGSGAFVMQYVFWLALVIGGICILVAIIRNLDSILDS